MAVVSLNKFFLSVSLLFLFLTNGTVPLYAQNEKSGVQTIVRYDPASGLYIFEKKIGSHLLETPTTMTQEEYLAFRLKKMQGSYFIERDRESRDTTQIFTRPFTGTGLKRKTDPLTSLFGPGGIQLTTKGTVEIDAGMKRTTTNNPTLPLRARKRNMFNFDQQIQLNLNAKVGNKIDFNLNYDTEASFDFQSKEVKLAYQGDEDEIIRHIEAGNVSMTTSNPLIDGGAALFGIKADLQFGKLHVNTLYSRQESEVRTVNSSGGKQVTPFSLSADQYDENRHFFLAHWFRDNYNHAMGNLPFVRSPISITRIEVWVTNRKGDYSQVRNVIALADLGEYSHIYNPTWQPMGSESFPHNRSNTLYEELVNTQPGIRNIRQGLTSMPGNMLNGTDYEKLENARLLSPTEYSFQPQLGYLSLAMPLQPGEMLAVAFEYSSGGEVYQVGEFSADIGTTNSEEALFLKLLKPVSLSPASPTWDLMMKNIYSLGHAVYNLEEDHFQLEITRQSDTTGVYLNYLPGSGIDNQILLNVMQLDRLNERGDPYPDGVFDYLDGYTVDSQNGTIIFPVTEPFGSHLAQMIGNESIAKKFLFQELYDSTRTVAQQLAEQNKYRLSGEYRASSDAVISLNTMNVARGSVKVTAGGVILTEGVDYSVDYLLGSVTILNQSILDAGTPVSVSMEERTFSQMQRKTLMGVNLLYNLTKDLSIGATMMHYTEKPLIVKTAFGEEATKNMLWGTNLNWKKESVALTGLLDMLPFTHATTPSQITADLAFAQMIPGHYSNQYTGGYAYLDDFESAASLIDLSSPYAWSLAATPTDNSPSSLFPEGTMTNHIDNGKNRALLAWYYIDGIFTRKNSSLTPTHIGNDPDQLSDHRVRAIPEQEVFPERELLYGQPTTLPVLNLAYYPNERGPYNLDREVDRDGYLLNPAGRWGAITRPLETRNFETANVEYIEFWLMDPFASDSTGNANGGDLYFHLGEISEDVLRDGRKFYENGIPAGRDSSAVEQTVWGLTPKRQSTIYAFDNSQGEVNRRLQDVGLNGLGSEEEKKFPTYARYLEELKPRLADETLARMKEDPHSPLNDPAGDLFRHYRGEEHDRKQLTILERYKYYNGTEGNSQTPENNASHLTASRNAPDGEDIDNDNTLNEQEGYYSYRISLRREDLQPGSNCIADKREVSVTLRNGNHSKVSWYLFRIPISEYQSKIGNIQGFHNIRFMRMLLTDFEEPTFLRFATLGLVRSEWRTYQNSLASGGSQTGTGQLSITAINLEENGNKTPVNYVMPPGVTRIIDPSQPQLRQENEQSISLKVTQLESGDDRAIYKNVMHDLRRYKRIQMYVHAEQLDESPETLLDGDLSLFLRMGSDYRNNFYEIEIPLSLTPEGRYSSHLASDRELVWPDANKIDFSLEQLTQLKLKRDALIRNREGADYFTTFTEANREKPGSQISITGNPSLAEIKVMMIGIRNNSQSTRSGEVWINELRLSEFDEKGGWAASGNVGLTLSDIGAMELSVRKETAGFGALSEGLQQRRNNNYSSFNFTLNMDIGRFLPQKAKITAPLFYSISNNQETPLYNPFSNDILLAETIEHLATSRERDSVQRIVLTQSIHKSLGLNNLKVNIRSASPMPYDPANFTFSYSHNQLQQRNPETEYATESDQRLQALYSYLPSIKPWEPFRNLKESGYTSLLRSFKFRYLPDQISLSHRLQRNYRERQMRDLNAYMSGETSSQPAYLTFSHNFYWDRQFNLTWNITPRLSSSFRSGTIAEIEEPYLQVNKLINRSDYDVWRDSVTLSLRDLGKPLRYNQIADVSYTFPFESIPFLNWIHSSIAYHSQYRWQRGAVIQDQEIGNQLQNDLSFTLNSRLNLAGLYRKFYAAQTPSVLAQGLMMIRHINLNIGYKTRTDLPGYLPMSGDLFGQHKEGKSFLPGLPFAFGLTGGRSFIEKALAHNQLVINQEHIVPAIFNQTQNVRMDAGIEPIAGIRIDLHALREENNRSEFQYMFEGMPEIRGGSFAISTITLSSAFEGKNANRQYHSSAFNRLMDNRSVVASRIRDQYAGTRYPQEGFLLESPHAGQSFSDAIGDVNLHSADVMIPAFLAAYSGKNASEISLSPFPSISAMLPNWSFSANLTTLLPALRQHISELMINHRYVSQYRIGSYNTHMSWVQADEELGFIRDAVNSAPLPSSPYNIQSVSIVEGFNPLIEFRTTLHNNMDLSARFNHTRSVNLSVTSNQVMEMSDNDLVVGAGYRIADFGRIIGIQIPSGNRYRRPNRVRSENRNQPISDEPAFRNDLTFRFDISLKQTHALIRKLNDGTTQPASGMQTGTLRFTADYAVSRNLTLRAFYDYMIQKPLVSSLSVATSNTNAGISLRINFM